MGVSSYRKFFLVSHPRQVWLITFAHGVNEFYSVALPPILPLLVSHFDITYGQAGVLVTIYFVMYSVFQLPAGLLADRLGQTKLLTGGMTLMSGGLFVVASADTYLVLVAGQALAGIGGSTYHPAGLSLISDLESTNTEGRAMGIHGFGGVSGMALAPVLIGGTASLLDWRAALTVGAFVGIGYALLFTLLFTMPSKATEREPAANGAGVERGIRNRLRSLTSQPLTAWVVALFLISFFVSLETGAVRTFAPSYLFVRVAESTTLANGIYFVMLLGGGIASIGGGNLADRFDRKVLGAVAMGAAALLLALTPLVPSNSFVLLAWFFVLGVALYAAGPAKNALTSAYSSRELSGSLFGVMLTASSLGGAVGPVVFGVAAERYGMLVSFPLIAVVSILGTLTFLYLRRV